MKQKAEDLLTVQDVAALKEVDETSVRRAIVATTLKGFRKGKVYLVLRRDAEAWTPQRRGRKREKAAND